ncbi:MAG: HEAT repeat domain-containing protein [Planctomycetaceae bacterium]
MTGFVLLLSAGVVQAADTPSAVAPVMRLLKSGRVPAARMEAIVEQVIRRGNEHDLAYIYEQASGTDAYDPELRLHIYNLLADAAAERQVIPAGDLSSLVDVISSDQAAASPELRLAAIRLAGDWRVAQAAESLQSLLVNPETPENVRQAALHSLTLIGGDVARQAIVSLTDATHPVSVRSEAVAALASLDLPIAVEQAVGVLNGMNADDDPTGIVSAFLDVQGGSDQLATAIEQSPPRRRSRCFPCDMYSQGRSDASLSTVLGKIAGIEADPQPLTGTSRCQAERGRGSRRCESREAVFRRADLSCMKCHAVSKEADKSDPI